jgi:hypothetical protein
MVQAMARIQCLLLCSSSAERLYQIFTGFAELAQRNLIELKAERLSNYSGRTYTRPILQALVNQRYRIVYDMLDARQVAVDIDLDRVDFYFKRSYSPDHIQGLNLEHKVFPLGLAYPVLSKHDFLIRRAFWSRSLQDIARQFVKSSAALSKWLNVQTSMYTSEISCYEGMPTYAKDPRAIFMTQVWPFDKNAPAEIAADRHYINTTRANCIRMLRKEFGEQFIGGFRATAFAQEHFRDCLLPDERSAEKRNYLQLMHNAQVGVATRGLEGSIGFKVAEYVAASKAIVTERINQIVPGDFEAGKNYLEFRTPEECVERVTALFTNPDHLQTMMRANHSYYIQYLRPDALVLNTLTRVLSQGG